MRRLDCRGMEPQQLRIMLLISSLNEATRHVHSRNSDESRLICVTCANKTPLVRSPAALQATLTENYHGFFFFFLTRFQCHLWGSGNTALRDRAPRRCWVKVDRQRQPINPNLLTTNTGRLLTAPLHRVDGIEY